MTRHRLVTGIFLVFILALLAPSILGFRTFLGVDLLEAFSPWSTQPPDAAEITNPLLGDTVDAQGRILLADRLLAGELQPLWDGLSQGGRQLGSLPNGALYSPLNLPFWILPTWYAPIASKLLELSAAVGFMYLFLRRLQLGRVAATLAGVVYAFSGFQVVWTNWSQAHIGALIPGLFFGIEYAVQKRTWPSTLPLAGVTAVMWLEGFPSVTMYALVFGGIYALVRVFSSPAARVGAKRAGLALVGVFTGTALVAFQLIPFAHWISGLDTASRAQQPNWHLARRTLATLAVPDAFGSPVDTYYGPADYLIYGPVNYVEIQVFLGIAALALAAVAVVYGSRVTSRAIHWYLLGSVVVVASVMYFASPVLDLVHGLPLIGGNYIGRLRSVFLFMLAVLVGIGLQAIVAGFVRESSWRRRTALAAVLVGQAAVIGWGLSKAAEMAAEADTTSYLRREVMVAAVVAMVVAALLVAAHVFEVHRSRWWFACLATVVAVEAVAFAGPFWPQVSVDLFYPSTPSHEWVTANLGHERVAASDIALYPSTSTRYGIRSVTGHGFAPSRWKEALVAVDEQALRFSETFTTLRTTSDIARSPMLDRLSAAFFVAPADAELLSPEVVAAPIEPILEPGTPLTVTVPPGSYAGVSLVLPQGHQPGAVAETIEIRADGSADATGVRRIADPSGPRTAHVGVPTRDGTTTFVLENTGDTPIIIGDVVQVHAAFEDLPVVFANGTTIYERPTALPRIRWASWSLFVPDPSERLAVLGGPVDGDTTVLEQAARNAEGGEGTIDVLEDDGRDHVRVRVDATGPGYVVVADSMQEDWAFSVDGRRVDAVPADHVGVAVWVDAGSHLVEMWASPRGYATGLIMTFIAGSGVVALGLAGWLGLRQKRRQPLGAVRTQG